MKMSKFGYFYFNIFVILLLSQCNSFGTVPVEPVCSKFAYDEQLLEKMVRMEFFVENMKKNIESSISEVKDVMVDVNGNVSELESNVSTVQTMMMDVKGSNTELLSTVSQQLGKINRLERLAGELGDTKANQSAVSKITENLLTMKEVVENIKKGLDDNIAAIDNLNLTTDDFSKKQKDGLSDLSKRITDLENQVKNLVHSIEKKKTVAFNAMDAVDVTGADAVIFLNIILNEGNAYNKDTGIFTAPVDGIYQFNAHICGERNKDVNYDITVNNKAIVTGEFRVPNGADDTKCTSVSAVALVRTGEKVKLGGMSFPDLDRYNNDLTSFSGTLIQNV